MHASAASESCAVRHMPYYRLGMRKSTREKQIFGIKQVWIHGFNGGVYKFCTSETHSRVCFFLFCFVLFFALGRQVLSNYSHKFYPKIIVYPACEVSPTQLDHHYYNIFRSRTNCSLASHTTLSTDAFVRSLNTVVHEMKPHTMPII